MISIRYIPIVLGGIIVIIGINVFAVIRDSKMWDKLEQRNQQIENVLKEAN